MLFCSLTNLSFKVVFVHLAVEKEHISKLMACRDDLFFRITINFWMVTDFVLILFTTPRCKQKFEIKFFFNKRDIFLLCF